MQNITIKTTVVFLAACLLFGVMVAYGTWQARSEPHITIAGQQFVVERADTEPTQHEGLAGRESLANDRGMLFAFNTPFLSPFWMKGMKFPIDIIWIANGIVIGAVENAVPNGGEALYYPPRPVDFVLEVPAGTVARLGIHAGAPVAL